MSEIDERYKRGMIYTIRCYSDDTMIYVGSTINTLSKRFNKHKEECKTNKSKIKFHSLIENNDWTDWYIELYEAYPCNNKKELERREGQVIREIGTLNKIIAGRTQKEYCYDNAKKINEWRKKWVENNIEKVKEYKKKYIENNREIINKKKKEVYENNREILLEKCKVYRENNCEKILQKVCCNICGFNTQKSNLKRHQKSKKCINSNTS